VRYTNDLGNAEGLFRRQFEQSEGPGTGSRRYGLAYTLIEAGRPGEAIPILKRYWPITKATSFMRPNLEEPCANPVITGKPSRCWKNTWSDTRGT